MDTQRLARVVALLPLIAGVAGCAAVSSTTVDCTGSTIFSVSPTTATLDHLAPAVQNQVQFQGAITHSAVQGCAEPALAQIEYATWSNPDPKNIQISSSFDVTNGMASCLGATGTPVTLTGVFSKTSMATPDNKATVTLTCK
ncbi:MAG: hypothetical protein PW792_02705 [Acidobacteriaceae bacterium]|nr:hypothetical protein [Acidobacteriaceae bacterium]